MTTNSTRRVSRALRAGSLIHHQCGNEIAASKPLVTSNDYYSRHTSIKHSFDPLPVQLIILPLSKIANPSSLQR